MYSNTPIGLGINQHPYQPPQLNQHQDRLSGANITPSRPVNDIESQAAKSPQQVLNQQILATLNGHLESTGAPLIQTLDPSEFTPEKVADRIMGFIGTAINMARANGASEEKLQEMMVQAREGVEQGFNEARDILTGLGVFEGQVKEKANRTYDLIQQGLDRLEGKAPAESEALAVAASSHQERNLSLEILTQDGDLITLTMESMRSSSQSLSFEQNSNGTRFATTHQTQARDSIQFSVEGHLDPDEQQALNALIKNVDKVADKFFDGNISNILHHASKLGFDEGEIAGFSLSMSQVETRQASVAYRSVEQLDGNDDTATSNLDREIPVLADFMQGFADLLAQFRSSTLLQEPDKAMHDLFGQRLNMDVRVEHLLGNKSEEQQPMVTTDLNTLMQVAEAML